MTDDFAPLGNVRVEPMSPERWPDLEALFGEKGGSEDCWCMFWRLGNAAFAKQTAQEHHDGLKALIDSGHVPGMIAYVEDEPAGWCGLGPREDFSGIERSNVMKRVDDRPTWAIPCFFISRQRRRKGIMHHLIQGAIRYAVSQGATLIESYPAPGGKKVSSEDGYKGLAPVFSKAGFVEVRRLSSARVMMRWEKDAAGSIDG